MLTLYGGSSKETDQKTLKPTRKRSNRPEKSIIPTKKNRIIEMLKSNPNIARSEMAQVLGVFGDYASYSPKIFGE